MKKRLASLGKFRIMFVLVGVFALTFLVYKTSFSLMSNSLTDNLKVDKITSNYLSFNYADNDGEFYEVNNPRVISDFYGKNFFAKKYDFEVSFPNDAIDSDDVEYKIIIKDMGSKIDNKFIKVYLTDQNNNALDGYENNVPVYTTFNDSLDGKVIYSGKLSKDNLVDKYRLKIWISKAYKGKINGDLAYQISVEKK